MVDDVIARPEDVRMILSYHMVKDVWSLDFLTDGLDLTSISLTFLVKRKGFSNIESTIRQ